MMVDRRTIQAITRLTQARRVSGFVMRQGLGEVPQPPIATELEIPVRRGDGTKFTMTVPIGKEC